MNASSDHLPTALNANPALFAYLQNLGVPGIYLVGGAVRDLLSGHQIHDYDFALLSGAVSAARKTANHFNGAFYILDAERGIARVLLETDAGEPLMIDFAQAHGGSLETDLHDRDFTINAMAYDLAAQTLIDPLNGAADLKQGILRACSPESFNNDPARLMRAIRLSLYHKLTIEPQTRTWMQTAIPLLPQISGERMRDEFFRVLENGKSAAALRLLQRTGILPPVLKELFPSPEKKPLTESKSAAWEYIFATLERIDWILDWVENGAGAQHQTLSGGILISQWQPYRSAFRNHLHARINPLRARRGILLFTAIFIATHCFSSPAERQEEARSVQTSFQRAAKRLSLSNAEIDYGRTLFNRYNSLIELLDRQSPPDRREIFRYFDHTGADGIDLCTLSLAIGWVQGLEQDPDRWSRWIAQCATLFNGWWNHHDDYVDPPSLISGEDLIKTLGMQPGPKVGEILMQVREAQAAGEITQRSQALALAKRLAGENQG